MLPADGSHALRGSLACDALRRYGVEAYAELQVDAERQGMRSHAERGNDQKSASAFPLRRRLIGLILRGSNGSLVGEIDDPHGQ